MRSAIIVSIMLLSTTSSDAQPRLDEHGDPLPEGVLVRLGTTRLRHCLADHLTFSPDGKRLITAGDDHKVRYWDSTSGKLLETRRLPDAAGRATCFTADGNWFAFNPFGHIEVWDLCRDRLARKLELRDVRGFSRLALSGDGRLLASADDTPREFRVRVWDLSNGNHEVVGVHEGWVLAILLTPDGKHVITTSPEEGFICCWKAGGGGEVWRIKAAAEMLALSADGKTLFSWSPGTSNLPPGLWDATTGKPLDVPAKPDPWPFETAHLSADGSSLLLGGRDMIELWDVPAGRSIAQRNKSSAALALAPNGKSYATIRTVLQRFDTATGKPLFPDATALGHYGPIGSIVWSPDSRRVATIARYSDDTVRLWDAENGKLLRTWEDTFPVAPSFMPYGKKLVLAGKHPGQLTIRDPATGAIDKSILLADANETHRQLRHFSLTADGKAGVAALASGDVMVIHNHVPFVVATGERLVAWNLGLDLFSPSRFSTDARQIVSHGELREAITGKKLPSLEKPERNTILAPVVFSADSSMIAAGFQRRVLTSPSRSEDRIEDVCVWERATGRLIRQLPTGPAGMYALLPDGRTLITADKAGLHRWDIIESKEVFFRKAHEPWDGWRRDSFASAIAVSPDGRMVATGHFDTTILIWEVPDLSKRKPEALDRDVAWDHMSHPDPAKAYPAVLRFVDHPDEALPWLREHVRPVKALTATDLKGELADLDADLFRKRDAAVKRLAELGDAALPALRAALRDGGSLDRRQRLEALLQTLDWKHPPRGEDLRAIRAILVLERIGSTEAKQLVAALAKGDEATRVTVEAQAALARMTAK